MTTNRLTIAEQTMVDFLIRNKGKEFTADEIANETGIESSQVARIADNLRWKNYEVCSEVHRGVHYYASNTIWAFIIGGAFVVLVTLMLLFGLANHADRCPGCPPDDHVVTVDKVRK